MKALLSLHKIADFTSRTHKDFPTFLMSGQGPVEFGKKAFRPSKLEKLDAV